MKNELVYFPAKPAGKSFNFLTADFLPSTEIQKGSLQIYSREICKNMGHILSLAKRQLERQPIVEDREKLLYSAKGIEKIIGKLATLEKRLSFEEVVINGFANSIIRVLKRLFETGFCIPRFSEKGITIKLKSVKELVLFCILQKLIFPVLNVYDPGLVILDIQYKKDKVLIEILRASKKGPLVADIEELVKLKQRLKPVGGTISYKNQQWHILKIIMSV